MKNRLISLMLAGVMVGAVGTMAACGGDEQPEIEEGVVSGRVYEELYGKNLIVALYEKQVVLHKADVYNQYRGRNLYSKATNYWIGDRLDFKCSKEDDRTTMYHDYGLTMPDESAYDILCDECFKN